MLFRKPFVQDCAVGEISHLVTCIYEHDISISKTKLSESLLNPKIDSFTFLSFFLNVLCYTTLENISSNFTCVAHIRLLVFQPNCTHSSVSISN